jgi:hypothetical protein
VLGLQRDHGPLRPRSVLLASLRLDHLGDVPRILHLRMPATGLIVPLFPGESTSLYQHWDSKHNAKATVGIRDGSRVLMEKLFAPRIWTINFKNKVGDLASRV